jgi:heme/copper-type cytochrome/quinol oxidase subunit 2
MDIDGIRKLREEYEAVLDDAETKRAAYHRAIRELYMSGTPLRQLADQLGISHQRVHQIVGETPPGHKRRRRVVGAAGAVLVLLAGALVWAIVRPGVPPHGGVSSGGPTARPTVMVTGLTSDRSWRFDYEGQGVTIVGSPKAPPEIVLPSGRTVLFVLTSADVIHSLYVPRLTFKRDIVPGTTNRFELMVGARGVYVGRDAEFAGPDHALPPVTIRVVSPGEFSRWIRVEST